jgi:hypothetical protein
LDFWDSLGTALAGFLGFPFPWEVFMEHMYIVSKQIGSVAGIEEDRGEMRQRGREVRLEGKGRRQVRWERENKLKE